MPVGFVHVEQTLYNILSNCRKPWTNCERLHTTWCLRLSPRLSIRLSLSRPTIRRWSQHDFKFEEANTQSSAVVDMSAPLNSKHSVLCRVSHMTVHWRHIRIKHYNSVRYRFYYSAPRQAHVHVYHDYVLTVQSQPGNGRKGLLNIHSTTLV